MKKQLTPGQKSWRTRKLNNLKHTTKSVLTVVIVATIFTAINPTAAQTPLRDDWGRLPESESMIKKDLSNRDKVIIYAQQAGIDVNEALDVINCESGFNHQASSKVSTARGLAQFIFGTWDKYCTGDVKNADDNLKCFVKLYPKHKDWWECAKIYGYTK